MPDSISDYPPVLIPRSCFPPPEVGRYFCIPDHPLADSTLVVLALIGRPDDRGTEPATVVALHPDIADELAVNLVRYAAMKRRITRQGQ